MPRVASLCLPQLAIERLRRAETPRAPPEPARAQELSIDDDPGGCSAPRGGGWRPGARWARDGGGRAAIALAASSLPAHQRPAMRELGRRSEAAPAPFRQPSERPARSAVPQLAATPAAPLVLASRSGQVELIHASCSAAQALGLVPGLAIAQARALVPALDVRDADLVADGALLERFARHAMRHWTPTGAVAGTDGLWIDLTGAAHLHGGEERFCRLTLRFFARLGFTARIAIAETPGAAHAVARFGSAPVTIVAAATTVQTLAPLPVTALRLDEEAAKACRRFGIERIADLLPMPRAPLARRLGRHAVMRLDQAIGRVAEPITPIEIVETPWVERRLLEPISTREALARVITDLANDLCAQLCAQGLGARRLVLTFSRVDGSEQRVTAGTARAAREGHHLARLLCLRLETVDPGMGIEAGRLGAPHHEPLAAEHLPSPLVGDDAGGDLAPLVDQLAGRVGDRSIFRIAGVESDVPERAITRVAALEPVTGWPTWKRPVRLLRHPEPLSKVIALLPDHPPRRFSWRGATHVVVAGDGPERIHGEWWRRDGELWAIRDYYRIEDGDGGRYWVFRRGDGIEAATGDLSWWMHGVGG